MNRRELIALEMRRNGSTYRRIGERLGVGATRARQIVKAAEKKEGEPIQELSMRARNCLLSEGYLTRKQIKSAILHGELIPRGIPNYGLVTHFETINWVLHGKTESLL